MTDNHDNVAEAISGLADTTTKFLSEFGATADMGYHLDSDTRDAVRVAQDSISKAVSKANSASAKIAATLADVTMYPEGRRVIAESTREAAQTEIGEALARAGASIDIAEAVAYTNALPKLAARDGAAARADATMVLDGFTQRGGSLGDAVERLAGRDDAVGALVTDETWLRDYAFSRGIEDRTIDAIITLLRHRAMETAANSSDASRSAAAKTYLALRSLRQASVSARSYARNKLNK